MKNSFKKYILSLTALFVMFSSVLFCCTGWGMGAGFELKAAKDCKVAAVTKKPSCHEAMPVEQKSSKDESSKDCSSSNLTNDIAESLSRFEVKVDHLKEYGSILSVQNDFKYIKSKDRIYSIIAFDTIPITPNIPIYLAKSSFLF